MRYLYVKLREAVVYKSSYVYIVKRVTLYRAAGGLIAPSVVF